MSEGKFKYAERVSADELVARLKQAQVFYPNLAKKSGRSERSRLEIIAAVVNISIGILDGRQINGLIPLDELFEQCRQSGLEIEKRKLGGCAKGIQTYIKTRYVSFV